MKDEEIKKEAYRAFKESELAWQEFFKNKPEPTNDEEEKKEQEEYCYWYNYVRKQSDTGKTPAEMYKEIYGVEPPKNIPMDSQKPSRMMNFEWDEEDEEDFDDEDSEEEKLNELTELADHMFDNGVWQNSKEQMKEMSKRDSSRHMFRLGFFMHSQYMDEQMKELTKEMENMPKEDVQKIIDNFKENRRDKK
jgi:hypothetical protein